MTLQFKDFADFQSFLNKCALLFPPPTSLVVDDDSYEMITQRDAKSWGQGTCKVFTPWGRGIDIKSNSYTQLEKSFHHPPSLARWEELEERIKDLGIKSATTMQAQLIGMDDLYMLQILLTLTKGKTKREVV